MRALATAWRPIVISVAALAWALAADSGSAATEGGPRPLSATERRAVALALDYMAGGGEAWWTELASGSPLRALGREAAAAEIAVRAGNSAGSTWTLVTPPATAPPGTAVFALQFPSGADDTLWLDLAEEAGRWRLVTLRSSAEPIRSSDRTGGVGDPSPLPPAPPPARPWRRVVAGVIGLSLLALAVLLVVARRRRPALAAALVGAAIVALALAVPTPPAPSHAAPDTGSRFLALRDLAPLRQALTEGRGPIPAGEEAGRAGEVAQIWRAQADLVHLEVSAAEAILRRFPSPAETPLVDRLRAEVAATTFSEVPTALAYENLLRLGSAPDNLLAEAVGAFDLLGFEKRRRRYLDQALAIGTRDADLYYGAAREALLDGSPRLAQERFRIAWSLAPRVRGDLFADPILSALTVEPTVRGTLALSSPREPQVPCRRLPVARLELPAGFSARTLGSLLLIQAPAGELHVPAGCGLAPAGAPQETAASWQTREERRALDRLPHLLAAARSPGGLSAIGLQRQARVAAEALARHHRWREILELTAGLDAERALPDPRLARLRAEALRRGGRLDEATRLLIRSARGAAGNHRSDPATLSQLADLLLARGDFDDAAQLTRRVDAMLPFTRSGDRLRQIQLEKRLATEFVSGRSEHFDLRVPVDWRPQEIDQAIDILEGEWHRLQHFIPVARPRPIEVHFLRLEDFRSSFSSGLDMLGFYDGKIRVPLGDIGLSHPALVAILSHELAHALIAQATDDRAPAWFHEGLAQHVQLVQRRLNPIPGYHVAGSLLAFPLLDPVIAGFTSPRDVEIAYDEAVWTLHFIERRHGVTAIHRLLEAFRAGASTEEALTAVFGRTPEEFDRDLWAWCLGDAPAAWTVERAGDGHP